MEQRWIELMGVIKSEIKRDYSYNPQGIQGFVFDLESGEHIYCTRVVQAKLKGWKVKIFGEWSEVEKTFIADSVEPIVNMEELRNRQLTLKDFEKFNLNDVKS